MINEEETKKAGESFSNFLDIIKKLREPDGCPWDKEQTPLSMRSDLIEETFEAVDAISSNDALHTREELGDVLLNTLMIAYMHEQNGDFTVADCINDVAQKIVRRHPHVFPQSEGAVCVTKKVENSDEVLNQWDKIKRNVEGRSEGKTILDEVPKGLPPLLKAYKMQKKAAKLGFDWTSLSPVIEKVHEELNEVKEAYAEFENVKEGLPNLEKAQKPFTMTSNEKLNQAQSNVEQEVGDLLFAIINYARHLGVDTEIALSRANEKFYRRFSYVEQKMKENNIPMDNEHLEDEDHFWNEAKKLE